MRKTRLGPWCAALLAVSGVGSAHAAPPAWQLEWARGAAFYEVFVRSFADSNGDGVGDLNGLTSRLDYLKDLGVEALWLMPIFESPSYHGYDVVDYEAIDSEYGTREDFDRLIREAHRRGIRVVLDFVVNHTSSQHPWFQESAASPDSPRRDWYVWRKDDPKWPQPWNEKGRSWHERGGAWYYGLFWESMPDLDFRTPAVRAEVKRLASLWLSRGVDGFRLDAARHLVERGPGAGQSDTPETHAFWKEFSAHVRSVRPDALLVGEVWTETRDIVAYYGSTSRVAGGDELPMLFDFPTSGVLLDAARDGNARVLVDRLAGIRAAHPPNVLDATFLTNHDQVRVATELGEDARKLRTAASLLLTLPGTPFLYYGEELGLPNGPREQGDPAKRQPMPWDGTDTLGFTTGTPWSAPAEGWKTRNVAAQTRDTGSLLHHYRLLLHVRRASPALRLGTLRLLPVSDTAPGVVVFVREARGERVLVAHNLGDTAASVEHALTAPPRETLLADPDVAVMPVPKRPGVWRLELPPHASALWRLR